VAAIAFVAVLRARRSRPWSQSSNKREEGGWTFEAHRAIVERIASEKFDNSKWEWDGITVLVKDIDIRRG
jgi:hypothetical protein